MTIDETISRLTILFNKNGYNVSDDYSENNTILISKTGFQGFHSLTVKGNGTIRIRQIIDITGDYDAINGNTDTVNSAGRAYAVINRYYSLASEADCRH